MIPCIFPLLDGVCMEMYKVLNENTVCIMEPPQFHEPEAPPSNA